MNRQDIKTLQALDEGIYGDVEQEIFRGRKGKGWVIKRPTHDNWYETKEYSESGELDGVSYEKH